MGQFSKFLSWNLTINIQAEEVKDRSRIVG